MLEGKLPPRVALALRAAAGDCGVTVEMILSGVRQPRVVRARRQASLTLRRMGFTVSDTARYLRLHHSSVLKMPAERKRIAQNREVEIPCPDLSGEWAI